MKQSLFKKPIFWISASIFSLLCCIFSYYYFPKALPLLHIDLTMNRDQALNMSKKLAEKNIWGPEHFQQAVSFESDSLTKTFIELEGGGKKILRKIIEEKYYSPYTWHVRHFQEQETNETHMYFTPFGKPYGFVEKIPEDQVGAALAKDKAQQIAEDNAKKDWHVNFDQYILVQHSQETRPSNRIDHTFEYENKTKKIGDAPYRLTLIISGDKLTTLKLYIKVPEGFKRRYEHMRSANDTLARAASILYLLLYIFGGCILGLLFLIKSRWIVWKPAFIMSVFIALLQVINAINQLPLRWMYFNTAFSTQSFMLQFIVGLFSQFIYLTGFYFIVITAAESLTRKAFGNQEQFWKSWSTSVASSWQILGKTVGSYLLLGWEIAFVAGFYYLSMHYFGWWMPSSTLFDPNILATYLPWFSSIAQSLQAGFLEECAFRAVPLACAALLGKKFGKKSWWIIAAFIIQAIIFGAAHANYAAQPFYARLVELIIPSFVFGSLYLAFGLLPGIILHFIYDVFAFSLPLFVSQAPGIWLQQSILIAVAMIPFFIVLLARYRKGSWHNLAAKYYNKSWQPPTKKAPLQPVKETIEKISVQPNSIKRYIITVGLFCVALWFITTEFNYQALPLKITRAQAIATTEKHITQQNNSKLLSSPWQALSTVNSMQNKKQHYFIWEKGGKKYYMQLLDTYLDPVHWYVRYAQFQGDVEQRAEEYEFFIKNKNKLFRKLHVLPESRSGKKLTKGQALTNAEKALKKYFNINSENVVLVSATSEKHPDRLDWTITYKDQKSYPLNEGEARIAIKLAGDTIVDYYRYIHIPEQWERDYDNDQLIYRTLASFCYIILLLGLLLIGFMLFRKRSMYHTSINIFITIASFLAIKILIQTWNYWPTYIATFKTSMPFNNQVFSILGAIGVQLLFRSLFFGVLASYFSSFRYRLKTTNGFLSHLLLGISLGSIFAATKSLIKYFGPSIKPLWPDFTNASAQLPALSIVLNNISSFITVSIIYFIIFSGCDVLTKGWQKNKGLTSVGVILAGIALTGSSGIEHISLWIITGIITGILFLITYISAIRYDRSIIPYIAMTVIIYNALQQGIFNAFPGTIVGMLLTGIILPIFTYWWSKQLK